MYVRLRKVLELNCIKALSLPELQSNWIKLEKQLPTCMNPFFPLLAVFQPTPSFVLVDIPQMRFPKSGGKRARPSAQSKRCQTDTPLTPARRLASRLSLSLLKFHIEIPRCHSASPACHSATSRRQNQQVCTKTSAYAKRHTSQTFLKTTRPRCRPLCVG